MKNKFFLSLAVIAILCLGWWTVKAQLQKTNSPRQLWEYKTIQLVSSGGDWLSWREDNNELPLPVNSVGKRAELGNAGWELVTVATYITSSGAGVTFSTHTNSVVQYFKRPK